MYIFLVVVLVDSSATSMLGDLSVSGSLDCQGLTSETLYSTGTVHTSSSISVTDITTESFYVSELTLSSIYPIDTEILIDGDVIINPPLESSSFLQLSWRIHSHEDFEQTSDGWKAATRSSCNQKDYFLQGFEGEELTKAYKLPLHTGIRISASVHFLDLWKGETVFLEVNGQIVWAESARSGIFDMCAGKDPDAGYAVPVDIEYKGSASTVKVTFGSTLQNSQASFGVDDVIIYLK